MLTTFFFLLEFHADTGCDYRDNEVLYPLAYRTHSHNLGKILIHKILELYDVYTIPWIENVCIIHVYIISEISILLICEKF